MARWWIRLLPALLAAAQLALWPGLVLARGGDPGGPVHLAAVVAVVLVITAALARRRRSPVIVTAVVAVTLGLGGWVAPDQVFVAPGDTLLVVSFADLVALFSVSVLRSRRTTGLVVAGLVAGEAALMAAQTGVGAEYPFDVLLSAALYTLVAAAGRIRRRWTADRTAAAGRLAEAEAARHEAAAAERRRLARELHDVAAHHLTSVVVNSSTAQFLGDQRPGLRAEALEFAARTGRDALDDLRRLVAVLPTAGAAPAPSLADLADDFRHLGQVVTLEMSGEPPDGVAEAMHGIAREALTNTLRYAPGGSVRLFSAYGPQLAELVVEDDGGAAPAVSTGGLGGGRGITGMRERAEALGGTLTAGPRRDGGWRVRAEFPGVLPVPRGFDRRLSRWLRSQLVIDVGLALLTLAVPLAGVATLVEESGTDPASATLIALALVVHAAPLLWRRQHPWAVLAAVTLTTWLGPLLLALRVAPADEGGLFLFSVGADLAAVYAVAARGARPGLTWLAPLIAVGSNALALATLIMIQPWAPDEDPGSARAAAAVLVIFAVLAALALTLPIAGSWLAGHGARLRRQRRQEREEGAVLAATVAAELRALDERARVAAGLRAAVLEHAARVPRAADRGDLEAVLESSREALAAMRGLLDGLGSRTEQEAPPSLSV